MAILVTGGTKGIGFAIAKRLAGKGEPLFLVYHSDDKAAEAARDAISAVSGAVTPRLIKADIGTIDGATEIAETVAKSSLTLSGIVHAAAMIYPTNLLDTDLEKFRRATETNGLSLLYLVQKLLPSTQRGTSIVFISSMGARIPSPFYAGLGVGKALAEALIRYLVAELAPKGIRINAVAPGLVETGSVADMVGSEEAAQKVFEKSARSNPSGRLSKESDYASLIEYLLSPEAEFIQGQTIAATGGVGVIG